MMKTNNLENWWCVVILYGVKNHRHSHSQVASTKSKDTQHCGGGQLKANTKRSTQNVQHQKIVKSNLIFTYHCETLFHKHIS